MAAEDHTAETLRLLRASTLSLKTSLETGQWEMAVAHARGLGELAEKLGDWQKLHLAGAHLGRLREAALSGRFLAISGRLQIDAPIPEWDGSDQQDKTLLVLQRVGDVGAPIRLGRLIALATRHFKRCVVLVEPRLVPLFRRSFRAVDVRQRDAHTAESLPETDFVASYETLMRYLAQTEDAIFSGFSPLRADPVQVETLRRRYRTLDDPPLVGFSWASTNQRKDLPLLADWARLIGKIDGSFVSIQYDAADEDLKALRSSSGKAILCDGTVDSLVDLDLYASQVTAMDAVVTISNTGAHMAGALGVRTFVILDDKQHLFWPVTGETTPWYPHTTIIRKDGRAWAAVLDEVTKLLSAHLASRDRDP
jgi:hypothetical protein